MDEQENPLERDHSLCVVLPGGVEKNTTVHGSKPVMDLLVTLCASYHLNPSDYTVEVLSPNKNNIVFKPNSPIGSLEAERIVLKPRGVEEKIRRPYMPEVSVRLLINYNRSHKAVVRVNPRVPLEMLLPLVCDKCEFQVETTVLLRDSQSKEPLDLNKTLNEHGLREVFARDSAAREPVERVKTPEAVAVSPTEVISPPPPQDLPKKEKEKENTGFLSLFRRRKKKSGKDGVESPPGSPGLNKQLGASVNALGVSSSNTPADTPKKRRAPQPPMGASQSVPNNLSSCHLRGPQRSGDSTIRTTKRRAPPPPCANNHLEVKGTVDSLNAMEELREGDESDSSSSLSPRPSQPRSSSRPSFAHLHEMADPYLPSFRGKELSDARIALAKVLTSSISKKTLVKRLKSSTTFPKLYSGSSFTPTTQISSRNGFFCPEHESVVTSSLPTRSEWEDPVQRKVMTTFKVVPLKTPQDPELTLDVSDQITVENPESEASPEVSKNQTEIEEHPCPPDGSETETPTPSPEPSSKDVQAPDRPAPLSPPSPPPLDLDNQECPGSPPSVGDTAEKEKEEEEHEVTSEVTLPAPSDCSDGEPPSDGQSNLDNQSEILQSPSRQSGSTDMGDCGSYTVEEEAEEEVQDAEEEVVVQGEEEEKEMGDCGSNNVEEEVEEEVVEEEVEGKEEEDSFPPPPPPVFFEEDIEVMEEWREGTTASSLPSSQPQSSTSNGQTHAFSEDQHSEPPSATSDQSAPNSLDKMSSALSRFAQAVALGVQRSRLQRGGKVSGPQDPGGPQRTLPSSPRSTYQYGA